MEYEYSVLRTHACFVQVLGLPGLTVAPSLSQMKHRRKGSRLCVVGQTSALRNDKYEVQPLNSIQSNHVQSPIMADAARAVTIPPPLVSSVLLLLFENEDIIGPFGAD